MMQNRSILAVLLLVLCVVAHAQKNTDPPVTGTIDGKVVNESGQPLAGAMVFVRMINTISQRSTSSDADGNFRVTHPSNLWTDITVPFWSMPENTDHPTQKPEKLVAKIILSSTRPGDAVFDPFAGSGTTAVVAKKLGRRFVAIESDEEYCMLAAKRLELAQHDRSIQGYSGDVFWERNSGR